LEWCTKPSWTWVTDKPWKQSSKKFLRSSLCSTNPYSPDQGIRRGRSVDERTTDASAQPLLCRIYHSFRGRYHSYYEIREDTKVGADSSRSGRWSGDKTSLMYSGDAKGVDYHTADPPLWLVWKYEGDYTLYDLLQQKDFPYNLEPYLLGRPLSIPKGPFRKLVTIKAVMQQILEALDTCHSFSRYSPQRRQAAKLHHLRKDQQTQVH